MKTRGEFIRNYWKNYLYLEKRFLDSESYVSIEKENNDAFSFEYLSLFILLCNEFDAVTTEFCNHIEGEKRQRNINEKVGIIRDSVPNFNKYKADINERFEGYNLVPFEKFGKTSADWWHDYTYVKHYRSMTDENTHKPNYYKANLKNVFTALSALYLISCIFYERLEKDTQYSVEKSSAIFTKCGF